MTKQQIHDAAMNLPLEERMDLVDELIAGTPERRQFEEDLLKECQRRMDQIDRGEDCTISADEAMRALRAKYSR